MIFLTWIERRAWVRDCGRPIAVLWSNDSNPTRLNEARAYAEKQGYGVHCFGGHVDYDTAKAIALADAAHSEDI